MKYGHFDDAQREYVITRPDTPLPWFNYLGCEEFFGLISNTAGGYCFHRDARLRRLTRYRYNNIPIDSNGRYIYVRDGQAIWNPGWKPTTTELDHYECRHGFGYTRITGQKNGLEVRVTYFVPLGQTAEVWDVEVTNRSGDAKEVSLTGFVEFCLWDAMDDASNFQRNFSTGQVEIEPDAIYHVTEYRERRNHFAGFACTETVSAFDTSRDAFIGLHQGLHEPRAVLAGRCTGSIAHGWAPIAAQQVDLKLAAGQGHRFRWVLGYAENAIEMKWAGPGVVNKAPFRRCVDQLRSDAQVDRAQSDLRDYWEQRLAVLRAEVDDENVSRMVNAWNPYQCMATLNLSRSASGYESGIGRGMGYRDSNQDVLGVVHIEPQRCRERLCDLAATQLSDGTCFHQYQPLTKKGNADIGGGFNDDPLWLCLSVPAYIKETGDLSILDQAVGYADVAEKTATVMDHLELSLAYTERNVGPHGLPLIGHADWNDCLNLNCFSTEPGESFQLAGDTEGSVAESVMIAGLYCRACDEMEALYRHMGLTDRAGSVVQRGEAMRQAVVDHGWDGRWFLRAYDARGLRVGSEQCDEGQIFIEPQGWCIMGGIGLDSGLARQALDSLAARLATPNGIVLQQPAYQTYHAELGEISSYPPGYKENAGIFTHNNTWIQIAEAMLGRGDRAMDYYLRICPPTKQDQIDTYRAEPYCYSQMTAGPDSPTPGEGKNSWLTGTASWSLVAITQHILGVRPSYDGLTIDPCPPSHWTSFRVTRRFRGKEYRIQVINHAAGDLPSVNERQPRITVDGQQIESNTIGLDLGSDVVEVLVELGG